MKAEEHRRSCEPAKRLLAAGKAISYVADVMELSPKEVQMLATEVKVKPQETDTQ